MPCTVVFTTLHGDVAFYLAAVRLMERLRSRGLPVCRPDIAPMTERVCPCMRRITSTWRCTRWHTPMVLLP